MPKFKAVSTTSNGVKVTIYNVEADDPHEAWEKTVAAVFSCSFLDIHRFWKEGGYLIEDEDGTTHQPVKPTS